MPQYIFHNIFNCAALTLTMALTLALTDGVTFRRQVPAFGVTRFSGSGEVT